MLLILVLTSSTISHPPPQQSINQTNLLTYGSALLNHHSSSKFQSNPMAGSNQQLNPNDSKVTTLITFNLFYFLLYKFILILFRIHPRNSFGLLILMFCFYGLKFVAIVILVLVASFPGFYL
jgi:hypothetical protein